MAIQSSPLLDEDKHAHSFSFYPITNCNFSFIHYCLSFLDENGLYRSMLRKAKKQKTSRPSFGYSTIWP